MTRRRQAPKTNKPPKPLKRKKVKIPKDHDPIVIAEKNQAIAGIQEIPEGGAFTILDAHGNVRSSTTVTDGFVYYTLGADMDKGLKAVYVGNLRKKGYSRCETGTAVNESMPGAEIWQIPQEDWDAQREPRGADDHADETLEELDERSARHGGSVGQATKVTKRQLAAHR